MRMASEAESWSGAHRQGRAGEQGPSWFGVTNMVVGHQLLYHQVGAKVLHSNKLGGIHEPWLGSATVAGCTLSAALA